MNYNQNYFYACSFMRNSHTGQTRRQIFTHDGSNDADSRNDVPFWGIFHIAPHLGGQKPQKPLSMNGRFQAKLAKSKNVHIIKTTASISTKFCSDKYHQMPFVGGPNTCITSRPPSWKKSKNHHISASIRAISMKFGTMTHFDPLDCS